MPAASPPPTSGSSFPRRHAATRRFTLGAPRSVSVSPDGAVVWYLRSSSATDPVQALWAFDPDSGNERMLIDPAQVGRGDGEELPAAERARRERARESGEGIVTYSLDATGHRAAVVVADRILLADADTGEVRSLDSAPGAFDPRIDPTAERVAYVADGALRVVSVEGDQLVMGEAEASWGVAEFIGAEEFSRTRGFWWSPDGRAIVAERVDESPVAEWHIAAPVEPASAPRAVRYPAAGTDNAACSLAIFSLDGTRTDVGWDTDTYPYLLTVQWDPDTPLTISVLTRDQQTMSIQTVDPTTGRCTEVLAHNDPCWVEPVVGAPRWFEGRLVTVADTPDARQVMADGEPLSPGDLQIRSVVEVGALGVTVTASTGDPTEVQVLRVGWDGTVSDVTTAPGVHRAVAGGDTLVVSSAGMDHDGTVVEVLAAGSEPGTGVVLTNLAESPGLDLDVRFLELGPRRLQAALVMPSLARSLDAADPAGKLPVLLDPYGGPHAQRVLRARAGFAASQWLADQGFAVLVVDGRGTPGRDPAWEREVRGDLAGPVLEDQVDALHAAAELEPRLDLERVGIRGWSFGGYLAALAVLVRPDVFHAAVAGAPVTDWRLYDTAYTERYLGHPDEEPANYQRTDLTPLAPGLRRPLMLIHGLADDNVVVAHTLQLSRALLEAGRPHTVLPLSGVTHMTPQEAVAENLLLLQVAFLRDALGLAQPSGSGSG